MSQKTVFAFVILAVGDAGCDFLMLKAGWMCVVATLQIKESATTFAIAFSQQRAQTLVETVCFIVVYMLI